MCQVVPFTLPCCRKVYVSISKLPSCPDAWPKAKCPPELCIQLGGYEPEHRRYGMCWRCKAIQKDGKQLWELDSLRPGIDTAEIVKGLEELNVSERRNRVEEGGHCWFCDARGGCQSCGASEITTVRGERQEYDTLKKIRKRQLDSEESRIAGKRIKREPTYSQAYFLSTSTRPPVPAWPENYPDVEGSASWQNTFSAPPFIQDGQGGEADGSDYAIPRFHGNENIGTSYGLPQYKYTPPNRIPSHDGLPQYTLPSQGGQNNPFDQVPQDCWQTGNNDSGMNNCKLNHGQPLMNHNILSQVTPNVDPQLLQPLDYSVYNMQAEQGDQKIAHQVSFHHLFC